VLAVAEPVDAAVAGGGAVTAEHEAQLRLRRLQLRRTPHRIFLPTRMPCLSLLQRLPVVEAAAAADVVAEAVAAEAML
jgi:hypothetical protein